LGDSISKIPNTKRAGLVKWLKVKALNSSPSAAKKKDEFHCMEIIPQKPDLKIVLY
jgi:hypothetical protein